MKVLVIKLGALGDVIMSTALVRVLLEAHADDEFYVLTSPPYTELFAGWEGLSVTAFPRRGLRDVIACSAWLRRQGFERIYDLQSSDRSRVLCWLSGAREKIGNHNVYPYTHHPGDRYTGQCHIVERHQQLLAAVGIRAGEIRPWLPLPPQAGPRVEDWLAKHGAGEDRLVLMHAGASPGREEKRWPHFGELAQRLESQGRRVIWLGAAADAECNRVLAMKAGLDATSAFSIFELVALGRRSQLAVTNDSGPMHVLSCAGLPVYGLFGPSDWRRNHAIGQRDHVVSLARSNGLWKAEDYSERERNNLGNITAGMLWSLLSADGHTGP